MTDDEIIDIEDAEDVIEEVIETGELDIDMDGIVKKVVKKGAEKLIDRIWYGSEGKKDINEVLLSREEIRYQRELLKHQQAETKERDKARRENEVHALEMEKLRLEIARLGETKSSDTKENPSYLFGELPTPAGTPNFECEANPAEFKNFLEYIGTNPTSVVILGSKGYGKSALGHAILEYLHSKTARQAVLYAPLSIKKNILPNWLRLVDTWETIPDNALVLVDEAALMLNSRNPGSKANRSFTELNAISRQKNLGLIFISQSSRSLDINALMAGDVEIIYKKPPTFAGLNERKEVKEMSKVAKRLLNTVGAGAIREYSVIFASSGDIMLMKSGLSSYWNNAVSTMYKDCVGSASQHDQVKTDSKKDEILRLSSQGVTQQEIAQKLGVTQAYISMIISGKK